jgi:hypothetical protein
MSGRHVQPVQQASTPPTTSRLQSFQTSKEALALVSSLAPYPAAAPELVEGQLLHNSLVAPPSYPPTRNPLSKPSQLRPASAWVGPRCRSDPTRCQ